MVDQPVATAWVVGHNACLHRWVFSFDVWYKFSLVYVLFQDPRQRDIVSFLEKEFFSDDTGVQAPQQVSSACADDHAFPSDSEDDSALAAASAVFDDVMEEQTDPQTLKINLE